jgi:hypothetical protein
MSEPQPHRCCDCPVCDCDEARAQYVRVDLTAADTSYWAVEDQAMSEYGSCWCCARHGIDTPSVSNFGLCRPCGSRSPSACDRAHKLEAGADA